MTTLRYRYETNEGEFAKGMRALRNPVASATTGAIAEAAASIKAQGRSNIASAGFSRRWQDTFRTLKFPTRGRKSIDAAAFIYHKIPYATIFEEGGTIRGKPLLWLPLPSSPKRLGRTRLTPKVFNQQIGPLTFLPAKNARPPLLVAPAVMTRAKAKKRHPRVSATAFRRGANKAVGPREVIRGVPVFSGLRSVDMPKKFDLYKIIDQAAKRLPELYVKHLKAE